MLFEESISWSTEICSIDYQEESFVQCGGHEWNLFAGKLWFLFKLMRTISILLYLFILFSLNTYISLIVIILVFIINI